MFKSSSKPIVKKLGVMQTIDASGEVWDEKKNAMTLLPPPPGKCQACAVDHPDRKSTRLNSSHIQKSRMPSSA